MQKLDADFWDYADLEKNDFKHKDSIEKIIGAAYTVHNKLCFGFLDKVYHYSKCNL